MKKNVVLISIILAFIILLNGCTGSVLVNSNADSKSYETLFTPESNTELTTNQENQATTGTTEEVKFIDKSYDELTDSEKKQLKYYHDGYTFFRNKSKWELYKYGELYTQFDATEFEAEYSNIGYHYTDNYDYYVIGNALYFMIERYVFRWDFNSSRVEKYIEPQLFDDFTDYKTRKIKMLKHRKNLAFLCELPHWTNIVEVDTTSNAPNLEFKSKTDNIFKSGFCDKFISVDEDNYRIIYLSGDDYSCNLSLKTYEISDRIDYPFALQSESSFLDIQGMYYGYEEGNNIIYSTALIKRTNEINAKDESYQQIIKVTGNRDSAKEEIIGDNLELFGTVDYNATYFSDKWIKFRAKTGNYIFFFDNNQLSEIKYGTNIKIVDLWNIYYDFSGTRSRDEYCIPINSLKITT